MTVKTWLKGHLGRYAGEFLRNARADFSIASSRAVLLSGTAIVFIPEMKNGAIRRHF
jgi:hypothetical protein